MGMSARTPQACAEADGRRISGDRAEAPFLFAAPWAGQRTKSPAFGVPA
jgi:hypothetical protein